MAEAKHHFSVDPPAFVCFIQTLIFINVLVFFFFFFFNLSFVEVFVQIN